MKDIASYIVLNKFKEELLANDFINLPDNPSKSDLQPFESIYDKFHEEFYDTLREDLNAVNIPGNRVKLLESVFIPEDEDAQKATLCYFYLQLEIEGETIKICFKYMVFQGIIHCYICGNLTSIQIDNLIRNQNHFISGMAKSYKVSKVNHLHEFL